MSNWLLFTNAGSSAAGTSDYVRDVFDDVTLEATNNSGLTNTALTNPLGFSFNNSDVPLVRAKTLFIKNIALMPSGKWIGSKPTYEITWDEEFPAVKGYIAGDVDYVPRFNGNVLNIASPNILPGNLLVGVTGIFRRVAFLVQPLDTGTARTATYYNDGIVGNSVSYGDPISDVVKIAASQTTGRPGQETFLPLANTTSNLTKDLHDVQLRLASTDLRIYGVVIYFDDTSAGIDQRPGVSYVDKTRITTATGTTFALGGFTGTSIGGNYLVQKATTGYTLIATGFSTIAVNGIGLSGTNTINVNTGFGGSFSTFDSVFASNGTSNYIGKITAISTDALTVSPTMTFGLSNIVTRGWQSGATLNINTSLFTLSKSVDFTQRDFTNSNTQYLWALDPKGKYGIWGNNVRQASLLANTNTGGVGFASVGASGFIRIEGYCGALEFVLNGAQLGASACFSHLSVIVNGLPAYNIGQTMFGQQAYTVLTNGGNQWNSVQIYPGVSMSRDVVLQNVNFYERDINKSITYGVLGSITANAAYVKRDSVGATIPALGISRRVYPSQMYLSGAWVNLGSSLMNQTGGIAYIGATTNCVATLEWYGRDFGFIGVNSASMLMSVDGLANTGASFNAMQTLATESLHRVTITHQSGTCVIQGFDYLTTHKDVKFESKELEREEIETLVKSSPDILRFTTDAGVGNNLTAIRRYVICEVSLGDAMFYDQTNNDGLSVTIQKDGLYAGYVCTALNNANGIGLIGVSKNVPLAQASVDILAVSSNPGQVLALNGYESGATGSSVDSVVVTASFVAWLNAGDVIRPQGVNNENPTDPNQSMFVVARVQ